MTVSVLDIPKEALFLVGKAFIGYKKHPGMRRFPLPDFFIGAHAAIMGLALLTRDAR
jgi:predicted nucleic acid-binding protein